MFYISLSVPNDHNFLYTKKKLEHDIKKLEHNEYNEILNILKKHDQKFSENSAGIYFNLKYIDGKVINEIIKFLDFSKKNKNLLTSDINETTNSVKDKEDGYNKNEDIWNIDNVKKEFSQVSKKDSMSKFIFKNYLDKISIVPSKEFKEKKMEFPDILTTESNFSASHDRLLKKCKNIDSNISDFISNSSVLVEDNL